MQLFNSSTRDVMFSSGTFSFCSTKFFFKVELSSFVRSMSSNFPGLPLFKLLTSWFNCSILSEFLCNIVIDLATFSFNFSSDSFIASICVVTCDLFSKHSVTDSEFSSTPMPSIVIDPDSLLSVSWSFLTEPAFLAHLTS